MPKTLSGFRTIATGKVSVLADPRTVSDSVRAFSGPVNEANSPSQTTSSGKVTANRCAASAVTSSVRSTSEGVFCVMRQRSLSVPTFAGPSSMTPSRAVFV